mgnify:CR=1 FL=1
MKDVAPEERPKVGQLVNETRAAIEELLEETKVKMEAAIREEKMKAEVIDVTLPSKKSTVGHRHPNTIALEEVERIFVGMGYEVVEGPEVEYDLYNFEKLNIPDGHPAKDEQDTFYVNKDIVLRTQTSPVQARTTYGHWCAPSDTPRIKYQDGFAPEPEWEDFEPFWASWDGGFTEEHPPTHWMPLPLPPTTSAGSGKGE